MSRSNAIVQGSIQDMANQQHTSVAEALLGCDFVCLLDVSGSMGSHDSRGGQRRFDVAVEELGNLQRQHPGKIAVMGFSDHPEWAPSGFPTFQGGGTDLTNALQFGLALDGTVTFIVLSDGEPNDEESALRTAKQFTSRIDTVYVGPPDDRRGLDFLRRLAAASGGQSVVAEKAADLADHVEVLMLKGM